MEKLEMRKKRQSWGLQNLPKTCPELAHARLSEFAPVKLDFIFVKLA